jgi:hypothetical protein
MTLSIISQALFYVGISVGIVCASKLPVDGSTWPDTLFPFMFSIFLSVIGLVGWRMTTKGTATQENAQSPDHPQKLLVELKNEMDVLSKLHTEQKPLTEVQTQVTKIIENFLIPISSRQQDLYRDLGMERAAHILITLSYVQRILHRFQSALSDGYESEAQNCISEALEGFLEL